VKLILPTNAFSLKKESELINTSVDTERAHKQNQILLLNKNGSHNFS
jgi:hypothetical protein